jgi:hypothetical protein
MPPFVEHNKLVQNACQWKTGDYELRGPTLDLKGSAAESRATMSVIVPSSSWVMPETSRDVVISNDSPMVVFLIWVMASDRKIRDAAQRSKSPDLRGLRAGPMDYSEITGCPLVEKPNGKVACAGDQ